LASAPGLGLTTALLATMERAWPDIAQQLDAGARLIEVR